MTAQQLIQYLKNIPLETLSNEELDTLKEELIRFIVDIQIQKDINNKMQQKHHSTEDIQLEIMQKTDNNTDKQIASNPSNKSSVEEIKIKPENNNPTQNIDQSSASYQVIIEEAISEEVIKIYDATKPSEDSKPSSISETQHSTSTPSSAPKINFSINDKFRIQKKLFQNNNRSYEKFIDELNNQTTLDKSIQLINQYAQQFNWDENLPEYKLLIQYNRKRFQ
ncbi:MAG: hypothetical protein KatS3mg027_2405 [Bacteroidia bacterium]|nr:MAG: hypothetical protein KatS3mg027_2405 [Bacteroidia bacterium]